MQQLIQLSDNRATYTLEKAICLEKIVLSKIKFDLHPPTPLFFMETLATHKMNLCRFDTVLLDCVE